MVDIVVGVKINPRDFDTKLFGVKRKALSHKRAFIIELANFSKDTMRNVVPMALGNLRNSIDIFKRETAGGETDIRSKVIVGSDLYYASFVDKGTKPSPGRFVPVLGRRLVTKRPGFGMHPGIKPANFIDKTNDRVNEYVGRKIDELLNRWILDWNTVR